MSTTDTDIERDFERVKQLLDEIRELVQKEAANQ